LKIGSESESVAKKALARMSARSGDYRLYREYYEGDHRLAFATQQFNSAFWGTFRRFSDNVCQNVVDTAVDRLELTGFGVEAGPESLSLRAREIWQANRMDERAPELLTDALMLGDAYLLVWSDPSGAPTLYPQPAEQCDIETDPETPGRTLWGVKFWKSSERTERLNIYFPDRIEKYFRPGGGDWRTFSPQGEVWPLPNPYGIVPLFHFRCRGRMGGMGRSELKNVIPLQDALNKTVVDTLVGSEVHALPQRWVIGVDLQFQDGKFVAPFRAGADKVWAAENPDAKFGQFESADLEQMVTLGDSFRLSVARVSKTPLHYITPGRGNFPSGDALVTAEAPFVKKVRRYATAFGNVWEDAMTLALRIAGETEAFRLSAQWADPSPQTEGEKIDRQLGKKSLGVSLRQSLRELGYGDSEIERIFREAAEESQARAARFDAGFSG
jgi:hypothetical protein